MHLPNTNLDHVLARSRVRVQILLALANGGPATAARIARDIGVRRERVRAALLGWEPEYSTAKAPVALGLVRVLNPDAPPARMVFDATSAGRRVAKELPEAWIRQAEASGSARLLAYARRSREHEKDPRED